MLQVLYIYLFNPEVDSNILIWQKKKQAQEAELICPGCTMSEQLRQDADWGLAPEVSLNHFTPASFAAGLHTWVTFGFQRDNFNRTDLTFNLICFLKKTTGYVKNSAISLIKVLLKCHINYTVTVPYVWSLYALFY